MKNRLLPKPIGSAVYILPNMLTTGNLFFGFFSIIKALHGDFTTAAVAILLAAVFDILDGRVARLTKGTSEFGVQYDSLCDLVSFGLAPAFLMFQFSLNSLGRMGWIISFIFLACGALRLARFNVQSSIGSTNGDFTGLPIPMAAAPIACYIALIGELVDIEEPQIILFRKLHEMIIEGEINTIFLATFGPLLAFLMVSNIAYRSHKSINFQFIKPFRLLAMLVVLIGLIAYKPAIGGFLFFFFYALSGIFELILGWKKPKNDDEIFQSIENEPSMMEPTNEDTDT